MIKYVTQVGLVNITTHYLFVTWRMMNVRCFNPEHKAYHRYGGRGIYVSNEWRWDNPLGFKNFIGVVGDRPFGTTLDRENNDQGYSPLNFRWVDKKTQQNNMGIGISNNSGDMGVSWCDRYNMWVAQIVLNGETKLIGNFNKEDKELAVELYNSVKAVKIEQGDNAALKYAKSRMNLSPVGKVIRRNKTSQFYGVAWDKSRDKWRAMVSYREIETGELINKFIGRYDCENTAYENVILFLEWVDSNGFFKKKVKEKCNG
jgi:hypothetical protein